MTTSFVSVFDCIYDSMRDDALPYAVDLVDDPGLTIDDGNTVERTRPLRTFQRLPRFEILLSKTQ